ncbi:TraX family protein [Velocimicrobium porci]|nr:TraX family protein [Velocimicrobium porci]
MNSFQLKIIALLLMTFDHIGYMLGGIIEIPFWFHLIGRLAAPIFIFMCANGYRYTHDKIAYMKRLYFWAAFMNVGNYIANTYFEHPNGAMIVNSIFSTMFFIVYYLYSLETISKGRENPKQVIKGILLLIIPILLSGVVLGLMAMPQTLEIPHFNIIFLVITTIIPTPMLAEGSYIWIILGVGFYYCLQNKKALIIFYTIVSGVFFISAVTGGATVANLFMINNQWFMIAALPFLLFYNNQKGRSMKYLFYVYYPLHVYVLLAIAHLLA